MDTPETQRDTLSTRSPLPGMEGSSWLESGVFPLCPGAPWLRALLLLCHGP